MVPFKYPKHEADETSLNTSGTDRDPTSPSVHLRSAKKFTNSDILCKSTYPEGSNELFDDSSIEVQLMEEDEELRSKVNGGDLRCVSCEDSIFPGVSKLNGEYFKVSIVLVGQGL